MAYCQQPPGSGAPSAYDFLGEIARNESQALGDVFGGLIDRG